jgi:two-component system, chemotaxis family, response regulator Rcp1
MGREPLQVLLVEDNASHVRLCQEAMRGLPSGCELQVVENGADALALLLGEAPFADRPRPDVVLLDLNLPGKGGREVLAEMRAHPVLCCTPVLVLSTSRAEADVASAYNLGANCYIVKPVDFHEFRALIAAIDHFWFAVATLPFAVGADR